MNSVYEDSFTEIVALTAHTVVHANKEKKKRRVRGGGEFKVRGVRRRLQPM